MESIFDRDFYPTPKEVIERMLLGIDVVGKIILEPSAGKGNIVDHLLKMGAKEVIACEKNDDMRRIVGTKCRILKNDFFDVEPTEISHVDYIVMNPPFSADERHILHAFEICPGGAEVIALCNSNSLNHGGWRNNKLKELVNDYGNEEYLGEVFKFAERQTNVTVSKIHLFKQKTGDDEFDGYFDMSEEYDQGVNGIMSYNSIREIVNRFTGSVKMFDSVISASDEINELMDPISSLSGISFGAYRTNGNNYSKITRQEFKKELQKSAWKTVFAKMNMQKYVTKSVMEDINSFVEKQTKVPFTMTNVFKMLEMIVGTRKSRMDRVLVEAFEKICSFSDKNSTAGEKWKTNSDYKINKKFILPYICDYDNRWPSSHVKIHYNYRSEEIEDIVKALCFLTGRNYDEMSTLTHFVNQISPEWGEWSYWGFFRIRGYKKGTMHFEFQNDKDYELFNRRVAEIKGWRLPKETDRKRKGTERTKTQEVNLFSEVAV